MTWTTNQSFRGSVFTLAGDWQGSSLQISLFPRTGLISTAEEGSSRDRGLAHRSPTLLSGKSASWKAQDSFCLVGLGWVFFPPFDQRCYSKEIMTCSLQSKGLWQPLLGTIRCPSLPGSPSHLPARGHLRQHFTHPHLPVWCSCENAPVRFSWSVDWGREAALSFHLFGIWTGGGQYRKALKKKKKKACRECRSNPHISCRCCPRELSLD